MTAAAPALTRSAPGKSAPLAPVTSNAKAAPFPLHQLYATLLDETHQGVLVVDEDGCVVYANLAVTLMFPQHLVQDRTPLTDDARIAGLKSTLMEAVSGQRRLAGEIRTTLPMSAGLDEERIYRIVAAPVEQGNGAWCIVDDITEQVHTEQIRKDFVTNASHELRTPLSLIHGYIETLSSGMIKGAKSMHRCLEVMEKHSKRMMRVIEDMLTISRLEGNDPLLNTENFHVRSCVEDVLEHLTPLVEMRQPKIVIDLPEDGGLIHGDRFYWDQILSHLIENALKENRTTGLNLRISGEWFEGECVLAVSDDGVGIPAEDLPFVFKRFYRCGKERTHETKGTGLGLSIVKRAVEAHGGTIEVTSHPGVETVFLMHVPLPSR